MDRDAETATLEGTSGEPATPRPGARLPAPLQVRDPARYEIIAEHGRGGIGRVLRATDREFGRDVALKELLVRTPVSEMRFMREVIITARLEHPNIVPVHEAGRWPDGTPFYAMKLVSGRPFKALIEQARTFADRLALLERVLAVADAVAYAHDRGVIHRDLKPSNIIVGEYGETIVIDWGLAKTVSDAEEDGEPGGAAPSTTPDLTSAGSVLGTPAYMAPEQAAGDVVTERSDIYALGAILLDVLGGKASRTTDTESAAASGVTTETGVVGALPRGLETSVPADLLSIARRALAPAPGDRYPSAKAFADDLRRFLVAKPVEAHRYTARERSVRWLAAHRRLVVSAAAVLVALLAASVWFLARESSLRAAAEAERAAADGARRTAEAERDRADRQTVALLEEQGRAELARGHPFRAGPLLVEAYRRAPGSAPVRWLLTEALRAFDALTTTFDATASSSAGAKGPDPYTYSVSLGPDDGELVTGHSASVAFWEPSTGALRRRVPLPWNTNYVQHSGDGTRLFVTVARDGGVAPTHILDAATGTEVSAIPVGKSAEWVAWSPDGRYLAAIGTPGRVDVWSTSPARVVLSFAAAPEPVWGCLAISPDSTLLAARGTAELILVSLSTRRIRHIPVPAEALKLLAFAPDSRRLLATMADRSVRIWDVIDERALGKLPQHTQLPYLAAWSGDGSMIATVNNDALHLWDVASTVRLATVTVQTSDQVYSLAFAHRAPRLVSSSPDGGVRIWDFPRDRWAEPLPDHRDRVQGAYVSGGARLVTLDQGKDGRGRLRTWTTRDLRLEHAEEIAWNPSVRVAWNPGGDRVALVAPDGRPNLVETTSGRVLLRVDSGPDRLEAVALSPDTRRLATASYDGVVRVWSTEDGTPTALVLPPQAGEVVKSVAFSPDGRHIATTRDARPIRIWNASTGQLVQELSESMTNLAAYSADGRRLITGGWSGEYGPQVWDPATGRLAATLESRGEVLSAALSADGALAATIDSNGVVQLSDAATGATLRRIDGPAEIKLGGTAMPTPTVAFSPDGTRLFTAGTGYVLIWNIELDPRSPAEAAAVVEAKSPWRLIDGRLSLRKP